MCIKMNKIKSDVKPGDIIHIYTMFGEPHYSDREGVVKYIDDIGGILNFDDDWEIIG